MRRAQDVFRFAAMESAARRRAGLCLRHLGEWQEPPRLHPARAAAPGGGDHAVQPPAEPGRAQGGAGDRHEQRDGPEALEPDAALRPAPGADHARGRAARRHGHRWSPGMPRRSGRSSGRTRRSSSISLTGGTEIGKRVAGEMGYRRAILELGGNDPLIVLRDADLDEAVRLATSRRLQELGAALHGGQADHRRGADRRRTRRRDRRRRRRAEGRRSARSRDRHRHGHQRGGRDRRSSGERMMRVAAGATLLYGGERRGAQLTPAVLDQVRPEMEIVACETFGPYAPILRVPGSRCGHRHGQSAGFRALLRRGDQRPRARSTAASASCGSAPSTSARSPAIAPS